MAPCSPLSFSCSRRSSFGHPLFCHGATSLLDRPLIPVVAPADASLWLSLFPTPEHVWAVGIDAADRALGTLSTAVVVLDTGGVPDAFYVAETALRAGRRVFFPRAVGFRWPGLGTAANVGGSVGTLLDSLALLARMGRAFSTRCTC